MEIKFGPPIRKKRLGYIVASIMNRINLGCTHTSGSRVLAHEFSFFFQGRCVCLMNANHRVFPFRYVNMDESQPRAAHPQVPPPIVIPKRYKEKGLMLLLPPLGVCKPWWWCIRSLGLPPFIYIFPSSDNYQIAYRRNKKKCCVCWWRDLEEGTDVHKWSRERDTISVLLFRPGPVSADG